MRRAVASIVAGIAVVVLTGVAARFLIEATMWSPARGGISDEITLNVLSLLAMAVPPGCGFLAARTIYHWRPQRRPIPATAAISLNCPHCGLGMRPSAEYSDTPQYTVVVCPIHGPLYYGPDADLTLGRPPRI